MKLLPKGFSAEVHDGVLVVSGPGQVSIFPYPAWKRRRNMAFLIDNIHSEFEKASIFAKLVKE